MTEKLSEKLDAWDVQEGIELDSWAWLKREVIILEEQLREYKWQATISKEQTEEFGRANEHLKAVLEVAAKELPHDHGILALHDEQETIET